MPLPKSLQPRIQIQAIEPMLDCGRFAVKRTVGDRVDVYATVFKDGHDTLGGAVRVRGPGDADWHEEPLTPLGNDRWSSAFTVDRPGRWEFAVAAWTDRIATWQDELRRKVAAGQEDLAGELSEGAVLFGGVVPAVESGLAAEAGDRHDVVESAPVAVDVDRELARFGAWYELFPRSFGGFVGVADALPRLAGLGFDVVYLPPVHPIGVSNRKGRNNAVSAEPGDVGSPWAIGSAEGGHDAISPELGTWADFDAMVAAARRAGVEIALDFAIKCSPDHPWLKEHPEWFNRRPDGTLKYAENPPKRYQDIYNVNFESEDWQGLWQALRDVVLHWVAARRHRVPGRQPAHEAGGVLGVADRGGAPRPSRGDLPRGGVHAPVDDDDAREARVFAELHVLHVEEHEAGARRIRRAAAARGRSSTGRTRS